MQYFLVAGAMPNRGDVPAPAVVCQHFDPPRYGSKQDQTLEQLLSDLGADQFKALSDLASQVYYRLKQPNARFKQSHYKVCGIGLYRDSDDTTTPGLLLCSHEWGGRKELPQFLSAEALDQYFRTEALATTS